MTPRHHGLPCGAQLRRQLEGSRSNPSPQLAGSSPDTLANLPSWSSNNSMVEHETGVARWPTLPINGMALTKN